MADLPHLFDHLRSKLTRKIAKGGMGVVYEARPPGAGYVRKVFSINVIRENHSALEDFQNDFIGEAWLGADLIHPNIIQTYHLGPAGGQYFMVMEFVRGLSLEQFPDRHRGAGPPVPAAAGARS